MTVHPAELLQGEIEVPGDKSISHRAVIFGALSRGRTILHHLLEGEDLLRTVQIFRDLGVSIEKKRDAWVVEGRGVSGLKRSPAPLYCGNSGTTMRLMAGVLAALPFESVLTGDASLDRRPMGRVMEPLTRMGGKIFEETRKGRRFIHIAASGLKPIRYRMPVPSAQVKSALLLAGFVSGVKVEVQESIKTRDHTERMLKLFRDRCGKELTLPGDPSSAAFFVVAALIHPDPKTGITLRNVCVNSTRTGFLKVLERMGGKSRKTPRPALGGEEVADLRITPHPLSSVTIGGKIVPSLIDEVPILAAAASRAKGKSLFRGMGELRVKESDRIRSIASQFSRFGIQEKKKKTGFDRGATLESYGDHRMAMSLAVLGSVASGESEIRDVDCIQTSYPDFVRTFNEIGGNLLLTP
ncbi:MAG: 3-phosphoshikimate 1-carboxyvinyltransferase [Deltaproteobacteria bacterium]|nr:3-phosphoshikimate 1-carboxyvinyltransferase [Deltaproteobacteria bacterium]